MQSSLAFVKFWLDWDWPSAETGFRAAIALDPATPWRIARWASSSRTWAAHAEAAIAARQACQLDPLHAGHFALSSQVAFNARDYPAAVQFARQATVLDPEFWVGHLQLAQACEQLHDREPALAALQHAWRFSGGNSKVLALRGYILARLGRRDEAGEVLATLENAARARYVPPYAAALVHGGLGHQDLALDCLKRAWDARDVHLAFLPVDPKWDALRAEPRFRALLDRCAFAHTPVCFKGKFLASGRK